VDSHLIQVVNWKIHTICFISKTLSDTQRRWSTAAKKLYAIIYDIIKLRAQLGGRFFTVFTGYQTLACCYRNNDSPKVVRWKLPLLEFDFNIKHIEGLKKLCC